jgi:hypothetical protein
VDEWPLPPLYGVPSANMRPRCTSGDEGCTRSRIGDDALRTRVRSLISMRLPKRDGEGMFSCAEAPEYDRAVGVKAIYPYLDLIPEENGSKTV